MPNAPSTVPTTHRAQAQVYMQERDDEMTYFLLFRHAHLVLSNLATHSQYDKTDPKIKALSNEVRQNLKALELPAKASGR